MSDCECLADCPFFQDRMSDMPSVTALLIERYCRSDWETCARHRVFVELGRDAIPVDMFPDQDLIAEEILLALRRG